MGCSQGVGGDLVGDGKSGTWSCGRILTNLTKPLDRNSNGCMEGALNRSGRSGGRDLPNLATHFTYRFWKVFSGAHRDKGGTYDQSARPCGYGRPEALTCNYGEPRIIENRPDGGEYGPIWRGSDFGATMAREDGMGCAGRGLATGRRSGRGMSVPWHVLADGEQGGSKKSSKKTYEIFFVGRRRLRRRRPWGREWLGRENSAL